MAQLVDDNHDPEHDDDQINLTQSQSKSFLKPTGAALLLDSLQRNLARHKLSFPCNVIFPVKPARPSRGQLASRVHRNDFFYCRRFAAALPLQSLFHGVGNGGEGNPAGQKGLHRYFVRRIQGTGGGSTLFLGLICELQIDEISRYPEGESPGSAARSNPARAPARAPGSDRSCAYWIGIRISVAETCAITLPSSYSTMA